MGSPSSPDLVPHTATDLTAANLRPPFHPGVQVQPERPVQTTLAFHASRIVIDVGVLLAMASMSMTFVISAAGDRSGLDADALPAVLLLLPIFAVTLTPDHTRPLHPALGWVSLVLGLTALPYALVKMLDAGVLADTLNGSVGLGARLLVFGCAVTLVGIGIGIARSMLGLAAGGTPGRGGSFITKKVAKSGPRPNQSEPIRTVEQPATTPRPSAGTHDQNAASKVVPASDGSGEEPSPSAPQRDPVPEPAPRPSSKRAVPLPSPNETSQPATAKPTPEASPQPTTPVSTPQPPPERPPLPPVEEAAPPRHAEHPDHDRPAPIPKPAPPHQPEIVFPDTGAVAREADPEPVENDLMNTAERADAALSDHLLSMLDPGDDPVDPPQTDE